MNTFLKVTLSVVGVLVAIKLLPLALGIGCVLAAVLALLAGLGVSLFLVLACAALALVLMLSPLWVPVLVIVGIIALVRRPSGTVA